MVAGCVVITFWKHGEEVTSFSMAATTFVGQNYGAGNLKRVKNGMWVTLGMSVLYTLCTGTLLLAAPYDVAG